MNKLPDKFDTDTVEDDFTSSMARLAELASQNIESDEKKRQKDRADKDEQFSEFMTAKRKNPQNLNWSSRFLGKNHKIKINPYIASGLLIILISSGFICAPKISKYFEEKAAELERKKAVASQIASQTDASLKSYTVFDAARDVSNSQTALKTKSISELAQEVAAANEKFGSKLEVSWNFTGFNLAPETASDSIEINQDRDSSSSEENHSTTLPSIDPLILIEWDKIDYNLNVSTEFDFIEECIDPNLLFEDSQSEVILRDILLNIGAIGGSKLSRNSCS